MLKKAYLYISIPLVVLNACKKPVTVSQVVVKNIPVVEIGNEKIQSSEFLQSYEAYKTTADTLQDLTVEEYLPIFTENRLKLYQAKATGRDTSAQFREEIASYRSQLAKNYLKDQSLIDELSKEAYERMKWMVKASHILVAVARDASPADTLRAYRAAIAMKGRLEEGENFDEMATRFSKDPTAAQNHGNLGYFTAFQMVYPLETAAYSTPVGKISDPIRSRNGYHLVKVMDRKANPGHVQVSHIMIRTDSTDSETKQEIIKAQIYDAYNKLQEGAPWTEVLQAYTDDKQSIGRDGQLPVFGIGQMVPEIEQTAFSLSKIGAYSTPIKSIYGWHILKLVDKKNLGSYEDMRASLQQRVVTDSRGDHLAALTAERLRKKYTPIEDPEGWKQVATLADTSLLRGQWDYLRAVNNDWQSVNLFNIKGTPYPALDFLQTVKKNQVPVDLTSSPLVLMRRLYNEYLNNRLATYEREHLEDTSPEFKALISRTKEGVLLAQMMEEQVWQRSLSDSLGQVATYNKNPQKYRYPERAYGRVILASDQNTLGNIQDLLSQKPFLLTRKTKEILFDKQKAEITADHASALKELVVLLKTNPDYLVEVAGYRTSEEAERASADRIRNVVNHLVANDISILRILEKDYGSFRPTTIVERNRRVGFQLYSNSVEDVAKVYNQDNSQPVTIEERYFTKDDPLMKDAKWQKGIQTSALSTGIRYIAIDRIESDRVKKFTEARGSVINDYQKELEKNWLEKLKSLYPVKVNQEEVRKIAP
ncbi:peptidyl-prolyl cis-trans isomerase SurA [Dyadobacter jejuensis]|uniref:Peptidyl-prolyl cis-trans isomerase SurA n=1 Tax=Dyadobacter jejuensis TaxID=1082580 RepID=A0A316AMP9_9BACT|nr:peptidylprolyl isomerase [Dyadobacter jejuensis]PWJ58364.1 peptidyl-prolyl cis-trans isomerase SurA [Dyadobacter jejuensis]